MIYVTVGNHYQPFDRLIRKMDEIAERLEEKVVMQIGAGKYRPENAEWMEFIPFETAEGYMAECRFVVSHAGIGSIISARSREKPIVVCPRRLSHGEHLNDHQMEMVRILGEERRPGIYPVDDPADLEPLVFRLAFGEEIPGPGGNPGRERLLDEIERFVFGSRKGP